MGEIQTSSVYQNLLLGRLRILHGDHIDDRINWVTAASGPIQRPTYTALFYHDGIEIGRGAGPTRGAAKESAAARALASLPHFPKRANVQSTNEASAPSPPHPLQARGTPSAGIIRGWRGRMAGMRGIPSLRRAQREPDLLDETLASLLQITPSA